MRIVHNVLIEIDPSDVVNGTVTIPNNVMAIGADVFDGCIWLTSITIPNSVRRIEHSAFHSCFNLASVTIGNGVKIIGDGAFRGCTKLTSITIPGKVIRIGCSAFEKCTGLTSIVIPDSVISIGRYAFNGCTNLQKPLYVKATNPDMTCRNYQYQLGQKHEYTGRMQLCYSGFHYCTNAYDIFNYYSGDIGSDVRFFEIEAHRISRATHNDSKKVCKQIKFVREIKSYAELLNTVQS